MNTARRNSLLILLLLGVGVAAVFLLRPGRNPEPSPDRPAPPVVPLPPYSKSRYQNVGPEAHYIGTAACAGCHTDQHKSYLLTAHSRALADVDPRTEPADASFDHAPSGRSYRVYRKDGQLRHEEVLRTRANEEIARVDLPVRYLVGSGHFSRTYLVEVDGFLHESPITWYASRQKWDMSPGYDSPRHVGFERPVGTGCLVCHSGRVEPAGGAAHRVTFHEKAIGCENCHGPGSLHQELRRTRKLAAGEEDLTIVHPGRLPRTLREAVCAACHQSGPAVVPLRGRTFGDSRPGRPLTDYRVHYRLDGDEQMTVVGHIEQLRLSACYQKSPEMTCVTCHDPHAGEKPKDPVAFYRQKCLDCHDTKPCSSPPAQRLKQNPADNCAACHMPRGDTEIPHIAFTHHRIGRHTPQPRPPLRQLPDLIPADDDSHLAPLDRERNLGLAYMLLCRKSAFAPVAGVARERARYRLENVHAAGVRDGETLLGLAEVYWLDDPRTAAGFARSALDAKDALTVSRTQALMILADCELQAGDYPAATPLLEELVRLRRSEDDWHNLARCYLRQRNPRKAVEALERALSIRPTRGVLHAELSELYSQLGESARAKEHADKARWLQEHRRD